MAGQVALSVKREEGSGVEGPDQHADGQPGDEQEHGQGEAADEQVGAALVLGTGAGDLEDIYEELGECGE
jgi:hypothetical protein